MRIVARIEVTMTEAKTELFDGFDPHEFGFALWVPEPANPRWLAGWTPESQRPLGPFPSTDISAPLDASMLWRPLDRDGRVSVMFSQSREFDGDPRVRPMFPFDLGTAARRSRRSGPAERIERLIEGRWDEPAVLLSWECNREATIGVLRPFSDVCLDACVVDYVVDVRRSRVMWTMGADPGRLHGGWHFAAEAPVALFVAPPRTPEAEPLPTRLTAVQLDGPPRTIDVPWRVGGVVVAADGSACLVTAVGDREDRGGSRIAAVRCYALPEMTPVGRPLDVPPHAENGGYRGPGAINLVLDHEIVTCTPHRDGLRTASRAFRPTPGKIVSGGTEDGRYLILQDILGQAPKTLCRAGGEVLMELHHGEFVSSASGRQFLVAQHQQNLHLPWRYEIHELP